MFKVYWTQIQEDGSGSELVCGVSHSNLTDALKFSEALRAERRNGADITHITMSSENPDSVGQQGVADVLPGYDWKKRRV